MSIFDHITNMCDIVKNINEDTELKCDYKKLSHYSTLPSEVVFFGGPVRCYDKFKIKPSDVTYTADEHQFRVTCLKEELHELYDAVASNDKYEEIDAIVDLLFFAIGTSYRMGQLHASVMFYKSFCTSVGIYIHANKGHGRYALYETLRHQINTFANTQIDDNYYRINLDMIISTCIVYLLDTYDNNNILAYYNRVTDANLSKELGSLPKRGSFSIDLIKPPSWAPPVFDGLHL